MGFPNVGVDQTIRNVHKHKNKLSVPLVISISGDNVEDICYCYLMFRDVADIIEINISSPNSRELSGFTISKTFDNLIEI